MALRGLRAVHFSQPYESLAKGARYLAPTSPLTGPRASRPGKARALKPSYDVETR